MEERLGEMRKGRRVRMRKGAIVSSSSQGITSWSSSIKIWFFQTYRMHYLKICHGVKQMQKYVPLMKTEVFILGGQIIDQKRKKGW